MKVVSEYAEESSGLIEQRWNGFHESSPEFGKVPSHLHTTEYALNLKQTPSLKLYSRCRTTSTANPF